MKVKEKAKKLKNWAQNHSFGLSVAAVAVTYAIAGGMLGYAFGERNGSDELWSNLSDGFVKSCNKGLIGGLEEYGGSVESYANDSLTSMLIMHHSN